MTIIVGCEVLARAEAFASGNTGVQPHLQSLLLPVVVPGTLLVVLPFLEQAVPLSSSPASTKRCYSNGL